MVEKLMFVVVFFYNNVKYVLVRVLIAMCVFYN